MASEQPIDGRCGYPLDEGFCEARSPLGRTYFELIRCTAHGGQPRTVARRKAEVVYELRRWGLIEQTDLADPGETFLKLITQSVHRVELLSSLLREAFEAAERLQTERARQIEGELAAGADPDTVELLTGDPDTPAAWQARRDLERVLNHGPVATFVGARYSATSSGDIYATGEAVRGLVEAESAERDRLARWCAQAVAAELMARQTDAAERLVDAQASTVVNVIFDVLRQLGMDPDGEGVRGAVASALQAVDSRVEDKPSAGT